MIGSRAQRVYQEALGLAQKYGLVDYDEEEGLWIHIPHFPLPAGWDRSSTSLLLILSSNYPHVPPDGFYIDRYLRTETGQRVSHYFEERNNYNPYADKGWGWFCIHMNQGSWRPNDSISRGDNLLKLTALIQAILSEKGK